MRSVISFITLLGIKLFARIFFRFRIQWPGNNPELPWKDIRLIVFLNHTSLLEPLFLGILPNHFLRILSKKLVAPAADKTLNRPLVGMVYKLFSPGIVSITRKRDDSWKQFMKTIFPDSVIGIAAEGRMKRANGLDLDGNKMTVRGGIADVLEELSHGKMILALSGGLHHVNIPGEGRIHLFKTIRMNVQLEDIASYRAGFPGAVGSTEWRKALVADMQRRLEQDVPL